MTPLFMTIEGCLRTADIMTTGDICVYANPRHVFLLSGMNSLWDRFINFLSFSNCTQFNVFWTRGLI